MSLGIDRVHRGTVGVPSIEPHWYHRGAEYTIHLPVHVFIEETDAGADAALEIESADGTVAIVRGDPVGLAALLTAQFYSPAATLTIDVAANRLRVADSSWRLR